MPRLIHLTHRRLVSLKGRDTFKYLQALTTNNLATPTSQFTTFLNAQGRILFDAFIYRTGESECLIEVDARHVTELQDHLKRYKLRSKVEMRAIEEAEQQVYQYVCADAPSLQDAITDPRASGLGWRIVSPTSPVQTLEAQAGSLQEYTRLRYELGVPEGPQEMISGKALPMESNVDYMSGVDFHKGCYLGQELTIRTHHTGVIRKRIVPFHVSREDGTDLQDTVWAPAEDATSEIGKPAGSKGRSAGRVLSVCGNLGLGLIRLPQVIGQYPVTIDGQEISIAPFFPRHWPEYRAAQVEQ